MSPLPVRAELKASFRPSGEYNGRDSLAGWDTSKRASPPLAGTVQISPPETNAISAPSGDNAGSVKYGCGAACPDAFAETRAITPASNAMFRAESFLTRCLIDSLHLLINKF